MPRKDEELRDLSGQRSLLPPRNLSGIDHEPVFTLFWYYLDTLGLAQYASLSRQIVHQNETLFDNQLVLLI